MARSLAEVCSQLRLGIDPNPENELPLAWANLIGLYPWQWFATFTFRDRVHPEYADKQFRLWVSKLNRQIGGNHWYREKDTRACKWIRGLELQKRGVIHFHALFYHVEDLNVKARRLDFIDLWAMQLAGTSHNPLPHELKGNCRIEEPRCHEDVSQYVSKYVTKDGEIDVSDNLPCRSDPRPISQSRLSR